MQHDPWRLVDEPSPAPGPLLDDKGQPIASVARQATAPDPVAQYLHGHADGTEFALEFAQDVEPILEANKRLQNQGNRGYSPTKEWQHVAQIPAIIAHKWLIEDGINVFDKNHMPGVLRKLEDPDWRWLRVGLGRLGRG